MCGSLDGHGGLFLNENMKERNAIILAAGKSSRFAPFTYERPKGLFRVEGRDTY